MTGLLQPDRRWKKVHAGWQTVMSRCPDCAGLLLRGDAFEHDRFHRWLDDLADQMQAGRTAASEAPPEGVTVDDAPGAAVELARPPLAGRVPVAFEHRLIRGAIRQIRDLLRPAPLPDLPPATIRQPPPVPVPGAVADMAARQVERAERRKS